MTIQSRHKIFLIVSFLLAISIVFAFSSTADSSSQLWLVAKHVISLLVGLGAMIALSFVDYRNIRPYVIPMIIVAVILLVGVLIFGARINGAKRWILLGPLSFQPSELAKVVFILFFADFFCRKQERVREYWHGLVPAVAWATVLLACIAVEPDLGTTILLGTVILGMLLVAGFRVMHLLPTFVVLLVVAGAFMLMNFGHVSERLKTFVGGGHDYQVQQALIALGSGGVTGTGLGDGIQKLHYVPLATTDFALAVVGEEAGLIGTLIIVFCYIAFVLTGISIATRARDMYGMLVACGITTMIGLQAFVNLGVVTGILPNKGIALPFVSAGGSAMAFMLVGVGILMSIDRVSELESAPEQLGARLNSGVQL